MSSLGKLYYTPTSCGAASFIAARYAGLQFDSEQVDLATHKTKSGTDFYTINKKGNVPALVLPSGVVLNEGPSVLQYIADQAPNSQLLPPAGSVERYEAVGQFNWVGTELHKIVGALFNPAWDEKARELIIGNTHKKLEYLEKNELADGRQFINGKNFTIVDAYLYIVLSWFPYLKISLDKYPKVQAYFNGIAGLDFVKKAHEEMNNAK